jgi:protein-tyrosine phosphatase
LARLIELEIIRQRRDLNLYIPTVRVLGLGISDRGVPVSRRETSEFLKRIQDFLTAGRSVAIHCRQGIGRSGLIAACLLALCGIKPADALAEISAKRGCATPETPEQQRWLVDFASAESPILH